MSEIPTFDLVLSLAKTDPSLTVVEDDLGHKRGRTERFTVSGPQEALDALAARLTPDGRKPGEDFYIAKYTGAWSGRFPASGPVMRA